MPQDGETKAEIGVQALRRRLAAENPEFAGAEKEEAGASAFCVAVRKTLERHREERHLQQNDVAAYMNMTQSAISKIENGRGDIGLRTVHRYARALGLRPVVLFVPADMPVSERELGAWISESYA